MHPKAQNHLLLPTSAHQTLKLVDPEQTMAIKLIISKRNSRYDIFKVLEQQNIIKSKTSSTTSIHGGGALHGRDPRIDARMGT